MISLPTENGEIFRWVLFLVTLPLIGFIAYRIIIMKKRSQTLKKKIKKDVHSPGMEDIRQLFKHQLKRHDIDADDNLHEKN